MPGWINIVDGIVQAVGVQVDAADRLGLEIADKIFVQEPARLGVVVAAVQVVEPDGRIVIVPAVTEGVILHDPAFRLLQQIAPGVVHILADQRAAGITDTHHVALQVLAEVPIGALIIHPRNAAFIVEIPLDLTIGLFIDDPLAVHAVRRRSAGRTLSHADAVRIVSERPRHVGRSQRGIRLQQPPARPRQRLPAVRRRIAVFIVHAALAVVARHPPVLIAVRHRLVGRFAVKAQTMIIVFLAASEVPRFIILIRYRFMPLNIFPGETVHSIILIGAQMRAGAVNDILDETVSVTSIAVPTVVFVGNTALQRARIPTVA